MSLLLVWVIVPTIGYLMSRWVDRNNKEIKKRNQKENYIYYLNKEKKK